MAKRGDPFTFTVEGSGAFPIDMLRYDHCYPSSEAEDSPAVGAWPSDDRWFKMRRVVLVTHAESGPTPPRWESHGWRYVGPGKLRDVAVPGYARGVFKGAAPREKAGYL